MAQVAAGANMRTKCLFVVPKKNRPCRMLALEGEQFCGEHIVLDTANATRQNPIPEDRVRIKCPLDPRHTCFLKKLEKHLKVCNARESERPPYYVRDLNAGDDVPQPEGPTIHQLSDRALIQLIDKISSLHAEHVPPPEVAEEAAHEALADSLQNTSYGPDTIKHLRQNSALLAVLRDAGQLNGEATFVELGSGKAQLSFWLARAVSSRSQIILVDFASHRHKAENKLKDLADMPTVQRLKIDIRHLDLSGCEACRGGRPVVAISKHLCGAATDLGIRAATAAISVQPPTEAGGMEPSAAASANPPPGARPVSPSGPAQADVRGIMIAVCCHHRVDWPSYIGKQFLQEVCQFSPSDFTALKGVAAWATCGTPSWDLDPLHRVGRDARRQDERRRRRDDTKSGTGTGTNPGTGTGTNSGTGPAAEEGAGEGAEPPSDRDAPPAGTDRSEAEAAAALERGPAPTPAEAAVEASAAEELQKRPGGSDEHEDTKRRRLNGLEAASDQPGPGSREASAGRYQRLCLTPERRTAVGFWCKRLLDEGRRRYLQQRGFHARLVRFVSASVSPENVLLLATR